MNEVLILIDIFILFGSVLLWYWLFGVSGLYCFMIFANIAANIEVLILVKAFGMEQTLGNVMFATTFLITDIISEMYGKEQAKHAVNISIATTIFFVVISQFWMFFAPSPNDISLQNIKAIFSKTPRIMAVSVIVYAIAQRFDVFLYHKCWAFTNKLSANEHKFLWFRNNFATLTSQLLNAILYTIGAFAGTYPIHTIFNIIVSSYIISILTSLADTPVLYLARYLKQKKLLLHND